MESLREEQDLVRAYVATGPDVPCIFSFGRVYSTSGNFQTVVFVGSMRHESEQIKKLIVLQK